ncbi:MAG: hypothetical protein HOY71_11255 [Nonomuraea sp.]|nr:hypothetical protein [Nonomuraea sp.]
MSVAIAALLLTTAVPQARARTPDLCEPRDTRVAVHYPITGYWMIPRPGRCATQRTVEAIHRIGADTLVTFGPRFSPGIDPEVGCRACYRAPWKVRKTYTYVTSERFSPAFAERTFQRDGRTFYQVRLPKNDLVLVVSDGDGLGALMAEAAAYGMKVYPGLPAAPQDPAKTWLPDPRHDAAVAAFTARVLTDDRTRYGTSGAFGGVYQSFELTL